MDLFVEDSNSLGKRQKEKRRVMPFQKKGTSKSWGTSAWLLPLLGSGDQGTAAHTAGDTQLHVGCAKSPEA